MSKGSTRRPTQVPKDEADRRWEKTFGGSYQVAVIKAVEPTKTIRWSALSDRGSW